MFYSSILKEKKLAVWLSLFLPRSQKANFLHNNNNNNNVGKICSPGKCNMHNVHPPPHTDSTLQPVGDCIAVTSTWTLTGFHWTGGTTTGKLTNGVPLKLCFLSWFNILSIYHSYRNFLTWMYSVKLLKTCLATVIALEKFLFPGSSIISFPE